jgi:hypothetical protein
MYLQAVLSPSTASTGSIARQTARSMNRRQTERRSLALSAFASSPNESGIPVLIRDISPGGLLIQAERGILTIDDQVTFELADDTQVKARVAWVSERLFGCEFKTPVSVATVSAALLKAEPQSDPADNALRGPPRTPGTSEKVVPEANFSLALLIAVFLWAAGATALAIVA